jgi:hypothetical protein
MGQLVAISCTSCSYAEELGLGCGELGMENEAMICSVCRRVRAVPTGGDTAAIEDFTGESLRLGVCPSCGREDLARAEIEGSIGVVEPQDTKVACPSCRRGTLLARSVGIWD